MKQKEEDFLFFLNAASVRILDYNYLHELFYSIIFLFEVISDSLEEKEFVKIWHSLLNILYNKMEFNDNFDEKENRVFEVILIIEFVINIISKNISFIESHDYYCFLEKFLEVENIDLLYFLLENNNKIVLHKNAYNILRKEQIIETLLILFDKYMTNCKLNSSNDNCICQIDKKRLIMTIEHLSNLFIILPNIKVFTTDSVDLVVKIIKELKEKRFLEKTYLFNLIKEIVKKIEISDTNLGDSKWDLFMQLFNFILLAILNENISIQKDYLLLLIELIREVKIPLIKFKEIFNCLNSFYSLSINLKEKTTYFWKGVFLLFFSLFKSNSELISSEYYMENLWLLFIRKYLISFVDNRKFLVKKEEKSLNHSPTIEIEQKEMNLEIDFISDNPDLILDEVKVILMKILLVIQVFCKSLVIFLLILILNNFLNQ